MRKVLLVIFVILFILSSGIMTGTYFMMSKLNEDEDKIDPQYAMAVFERNVETREFQFDAFDKLYFLNDNDPNTSFSKKTRMLGSTPNLKIVNSDEYRVEVTTHADMFDKLKIELEENPSTSGGVRLIVTFSDDCYVPVYVDDVSYDYDTGLYVSFDTFEVTVYAPISVLCVDSKIQLDYEAPKCDEMYIDFSFEGTEASIHHIDTNDLELYCSGTSNLKLSGEVHGKSKMMIFHDTKVDANELISKKNDFDISSSLFDQFSYIKHNNVYYVGLFTGNFLPHFVLYFQPFLWLALIFVCACKRK